MRVRITPALAYAHGHVENVLIRIGCNPPSPRRPDGIVEMDLTEAQIQQFQLIGNAHHVERLPEGANGEPAAAAPIVIPTPAETNIVCPVCNQVGYTIAHDGTPIPDVIRAECGNCGALLMIGVDPSKGGERFVMMSEAKTQTAPLPPVADQQKKK